MTVTAASDTVRVLPPLEATGALSWAEAMLQGMRSAFGALAAHKLRSTLTMIGIVVGVFGVLLIGVFSQTAQTALAQRVAALGANLINVESKPVLVSGVSTGQNVSNFTEQDVAAVRQVSHIVAATPRKTTKTQLVAGGQNWSTVTWGFYPDVQIIQGYSVSSGAFFTMQDVSAASEVAVVGKTVADKLFPGGNPIGQSMRIEGVDFRVVGVLTSKGSNGEHDQDDVVLVPFSTAQQRLFGGASTFGAMWLQVDNINNMSAAMAGVIKVLEQRHNIPAGRPDDFNVRNNIAVAQTLERQVNTIKLIMTGIAGVALLIGGFGIVNVMLASVSERTREIGIRMAVGAQTRDVLAQFLIEAITLSLFGGLIGLLLGLFVTLPLLRFADGVPARLSTPPSLLTIVTAVGVSMAVGVVFGYFPARRAAHLDPIQALRHA